jgi:DUF971 family protein
MICRCLNLIFMTRAGGYDLQMSESDLHDSGIDLLHRVWFVRLAGSEL